MDFGVFFRDTIRASRDSLVEELAELRHKQETDHQALQTATEDLNKKHEEAGSLRSRCKTLEESLQSTQVRFDLHQKDSDTQLQSAR